MKTVTIPNMSVVNYSSESIGDRASESNSAANKVLSVTELTRFIKIQLESRFPNVQVTGEISNLSQQSSGHVYFSLKDKYASLSCVLWRSVATRINLVLKNGLQVVLSGSLKIYEPRGTYQLSVTSVFPAGLGNLHLEFERRKLKYEKLGYFSSEIKKPLPEFPKRIAIVTSPTGAVIQDILRVINRRCSIGLILDVYPVRVQGPGAESEIAHTLNRINHRSDLDLIIVGRGGGSLEDLWAFNESLVIEAIYASTIPIISAVGHETDFTLSDFVADVRAATPSVAAELAVPEIESWRLHLNERLNRLVQELGTRLHYQVQRMNRLSPEFLTNKFRYFLERYHQDLDYASQSLLKGANFKLNQSLQSFQRFQPIERVLSRAIDNLLQQSRLRLEGMQLNNFARSNLSKLVLLSKQLNDHQARLRILSMDVFRHRSDTLKLMIEQLIMSDPQNILSRGYSIIKKNGKILEKVEQLSLGDEVSIMMYDGEIEAKIIENRSGSKDET